MQDSRQQAAQEALFCEDVLAKTNDNVLLETLAGADKIETWSHFPPKDTYDPATGAQWYYHCHPAEEATSEHGHFHCFVRPDGPKGPVHHLAAIGVDAHGGLLRIFTVNHWVVGDDWLAAEETIKLLQRFDVQLGKPNYLVNRWLTALFHLYEKQIISLIKQRDAKLGAHTPEDGGDPHEDRTLEVTSEYVCNLRATAKELGL